MELKSLLRHSVILLLVLGALMTLVSELTAGQAARLFVGYDPNLSALTRHAIRLYMISFFIAGINLLTSAWFTGLGNGKVSAADLCCLLLSVTLILAYRKRYGY